MIQDDTSIYRSQAKHEWGIMGYSGAQGLVAGWTRTSLDWMMIWKDQSVWLTYADEGFWGSCAEDWEISDFWSGTSYRMLRFQDLLEESKEWALPPCKILVRWEKFPSQQEGTWSQLSKVLLRVRGFLGPGKAMVWGCLRPIFLCLSILSSQSWNRSHEKTQRSTAVFLCRSLWTWPAIALTSSKTCWWDSRREWHGWVNTSQQKKIAENPSRSRCVCRKITLFLHFAQRQTVKSSES